MDKKLINIVKGDINTAILNGSYNRNTAYQTNIEFNTPTKLILLDGDPYSNPSLTKVTWQELKDLRDNNKLVAGSLYRITDYQCTTTQENTRSAGHQFDIVLLALSENKLAEEGWAMMHDNIYDVVFNDGTIEKCYVYEYAQGQYYIVRTDNLLGLDVADEGQFDGEEFNAGDSGYSDLITEGLIYNYFQNSNLSAWKVWYCLDNDKDRFAWASDKDAFECQSEIFERYEGEDERHEGIDYFVWKSTSSEAFLYTIIEHPKEGDDVYLKSNGEMIVDDVCGRVYNEGTGVIYRLIDEWNNDVGYDFKNIQYLVENHWLFTIPNAGSPDDIPVDGSVFNDGFAVNNYIKRQINDLEGGEILGGNILINGTNNSVIGSRNNIIMRGNTIIIDCVNTTSINGNSILVGCADFTPEESGLYYYNKKILTES